MAPYITLFKPQQNLEILAIQIIYLLFFSIMVKFKIILRKL